jgi:hypothetical protein
VLMHRPSLLSEAKFEEMLLVVESVNGKDRSQLIQSGTLGQVRPRLQSSLPRSLGCYL